MNDYKIQQSIIAKVWTAAIDTANVDRPKLWYIKLLNEEEKEMLLSDSKLPRADKLLKLLRDTYREHMVEDILLG